MSAEDLPQMFHIVDGFGRAATGTDEADARRRAALKDLPQPVAHIWVTGGTPVIYLHQTPDTEPLYTRAALDAVRAQERERWIPGARVQIPTATMEQEIQAHVRRAVAAERERWESALVGVMPADFKDWHQSPGERPETAAAVIRSLREREQMAWEQVAQERERCAKLCESFPEWSDGAQMAAAIRDQDHG